MFGDYLKAIEILSNIKRRLGERLVSDQWEDLRNTESLQLQISTLNGAIKAIELAWEEEERAFAKAHESESALTDEGI